jgi:gamma-glutamyl:cysteine ligase YbdK (ATP-grasp superfamily)
MTAGGPLGLFEGYGIEIEHAIVDRRSLDVRPLGAELLRDASGGELWISDVDDGPIGWSNELVAHLVELKTSAPVASLAGVAAQFERSTARANALLAGRGACLLPGAMHPWMDPRRETRLWPHEYAEVYAAYDRLFDCRRHGWANLQSMHLNLPFADEREFGLLMAAVRAVLPLIPALAASSPVADGRVTGRLDQRLHVYATNSTRAPAMAGEVIPEPVFDVDGYRREVLAPIEADLERLDAPAVLRGQDFTNARGAIARFDRMAIEIRLIDAQECARSDLAVAAAVSELARALVEERWADLRALQAVPSAALVEQLRLAIDAGPRAPLAAPSLGELFGAPRAQSLGELCRSAVERSWAGPSELEPPLEVCLRRGPLAARLLAALGPDPDRARLADVWGRLAECLARGEVFGA